ncbi:MAG: 50S ribosomal protein L11 methyltransferase [Thermodesulfobacteriota bacterium]
MNWTAVTVGFNADASSRDTIIEIVADLFYRLGLNGVEINEAAAASDGSAAVAVTGYLPADASVEDSRSRLQAMIDDLPAGVNIRFTVTCRPVDEENWADSWKAHFQPLRVGRHMIVKPTCRDSAAGPEDIVIEIDPGMAFGTGTHATTRMCLVMLERYLRQGMTLLDVGTGSGILMIAAFKLGAGAVCGVDNDPVAVETARANLALNRVDCNRAKILCADLVDGVNGPFDLVCANIVAEVVAELIPYLRKILSPAGRFVCSGILDDRSSLVEERLRRYGFTVLDRLAEEEWVCLMAAAG